jgi:hypothetical protein
LNLEKRFRLPKRGVHGAEWDLAGTMQCASEAVAKVPLARFRIVGDVLEHEELVFARASLAQLVSSLSLSSHAVELQGSAQDRLIQMLVMNQQNNAYVRGFSTLAASLLCKDQDDLMAVLEAANLATKNLSTWVLQYHRLLLVHAKNKAPVLRTPFTGMNAIKTLFASSYQNMDTMTARWCLLNRFLAQHRDVQCTPAVTKIVQMANDAFPQDQNIALLLLNLVKATVVNPKMMEKFITAFRWASKSASTLLPKELAALTLEQALFPGFDEVASKPFELVDSSKVVNPYQVLFHVLRLRSGARTDSAYEKNYTYSSSALEFIYACIAVGWPIPPPLFFFLSRFVRRFGLKWTHLWRGLAHLWRDLGSVESRLSFFLPLAQLMRDHDMQKRAAPRGATCSKCTEAYEVRRVEVPFCPGGVRNHCTCVDSLCPDCWEVATLIAPVVGDSAPCGAWCSGCQQTICAFCRGGCIQPKLPPLLSRSDSNDLNAWTFGNDRKYAIRLCNWYLSGSFSSAAVPLRCPSTRKRRITDSVRPLLLLPRDTVCGAPLHEEVSGSDDPLAQEGAAARSWVQPSAADVATDAQETSACQKPVSDACTDEKAAATACEAERSMDAGGSMQEAANLNARALGPLDVGSGVAGAVVTDLDTSGMHGSADDTFDDLPDLGVNLDSGDELDHPSDNPFTAGLMSSAALPIRTSDASSNAGLEVVASPILDAAALSDFVSSASLGSAAQWKLRCLAAERKALLEKPLVEIAVRELARHPQEEVDRMFLDISIASDSDEARHANNLIDEARRHSAPDVVGSFLARSPPQLSTPLVEIKDNVSLVGGS